MLKQILGLLLLGFTTSFHTRPYGHLRGGVGQGTPGGTPGGDLRGDRVLLSDVKALSLHSGKYTTGSRVSPIPQLNCESGYCSYGPSSVMCKNMGMGEKDVVWECTGYGITPGYKLRHSDVSCEGYDYKDDPYVLAGSCSVFYAVDKDYSYTKPVTTTTTTTDTFFGNRYSTYYENYDADTVNANAGLVFVGFFFLMCIIFFVILYSTSNNNYEPVYESAYVPTTGYLWYCPWTWTWTRTWSRPWSYQRPWSGEHYYSYSSPVHQTTSTTTSTRGDSVDRTTSTTTGNTRRR